MRDQVLEIELEIRKRKRKFERLKKLLAEGLVPAQDFEEARDDYEFYVQKRDNVLDAQEQERLFRENQVEQLKASLTRMESNLEVARKNLEDLVVKAPVSGYLTSLDAEVGESKIRGERLGKIDILDGFKIRLRVDEHYITRLEKGQIGLVTYRDREYELVTDKISPEVVDGRCEVDMEFKGPEPDELRRGQTLHVRLQLGGPSESVLLEKGGFFQDTGGRWVYVVDPTGSVANRREVRLGLENPLHFQVLEGLETGERVITSSYSVFGDADQLILK
jgi:HlyD family secretion protein